MPDLAFLGLGLIGRGMVEAAAGRGLSVCAWNRSPAKAEGLDTLGVTVCPSAAEAVAGAPRVHLALHDDAAVDAVLAAITPALRPGAVVVDHTTTTVAGTAARAARCEALGVAFLHAPIFMSPANARAARGIMMAAGPKARFEAVQPALAAMTGDLWYLGERPDLAAVYKLCGNAMLFAIAGGLSDVFALAGAAGVPAPEIITLFDRFNAGMGIQVRGKKMAADDFSPSFLLQTAHKDLRAMVELAGPEVLCLLPGVGERMEAALRDGHAQDDYGIIGAPAYTGRG